MSRTDVIEVVEMVAHEEGLTIYAEFIDDAEITIDGKDASASDRSWAD